MLATEPLFYIFRTGSDSAGLEPVMKKALILSHGAYLSPSVFFSAKCCDFVMLVNCKQPHFSSIREMSYLSEISALNRTGKYRRPLSALSRPQMRYHRGPVIFAAIPGQES